MISPRFPSINPGIFALSVVMPDLAPGYPRLLVPLP
jgi:hypothetical protein